MSVDAQNSSMLPAVTSGRYLARVPLLRKQNRDVHQIMNNNKAQHLRDEQNLLAELDRVQTELKEVKKQNKMLEQRHQRGNHEAQKEV